MTVKVSPPSLVSQETINRLMTWLICGNTGVSSKCLAATIMSYGESANIKCYEARQHPLDSSDFNRCVKLLNQVPELREHLPIMRSVSEYWEVLVDNWEGLETLLHNEIKESKRTASNQRGSTYARMKELYKPLEDKRYKSSI